MNRIPDLQINCPFYLSWIMLVEILPVIKYL
jgi:hypothetical protein